MAATPFVAVLVFATGSGRRYTQRATCSDVAAAAWVFQDGSTDLTLPNEPTYLADVQLSAAGVDTTYSTVYANQRETGEEVQHALNLASNLARQFINAPIGFKPNARIKIVQH